MDDSIGNIVGSDNLVNTDRGLVVTPETQAQMGQVVEVCHKRGWKIAIAGHGSKTHWGRNLSSFDLILATTKLDRLIEHAVGDLTVTIEAGMQFQQLQGILAKNGQFLGIDPPYPDRCTMGGIVATGDSGSLRHRYNSVRDQILGISFIRSDGKLVKAGGRVVKNVAGYDLMKLLTGSYGSLGIITQMTFRLYPLPQHRRAILLTGSPAALTQIRSGILNSVLTPVILDLISPCLLTQIDLGSQWGIALGFEGIEPSNTAQIDLITSMAKNLGLNCLFINNYADFWRSVSQVFEQGTRCKIGVLSSQAIELFHPIGQSNPIQIHLGSGLGLIQLDGLKELTNWRKKLDNYGGFLTILAANQSIKIQLDPWGFKPDIKNLMTNIKHQFDPQNILNPDRF